MVLEDFLDLSDDGSIGAGLLTMDQPHAGSMSINSNVRTTNDGERYEDTTDLADVYRMHI